MSGCLSTTEIIISPTAGDKRSGDLLPQKKNFLRINLSVLSRGTSKATPHQRMRWLTLWCAQSQVCWRAWVCVRARMLVYVGESERERAWMIGGRVRETPEKYLGMEYARPLCRNVLLSLSIYFSLFLDLPLFSAILNYILSFFPSSVSFFLLILILYQSLTLSIVIHQCPSISLSLSLSPSLSCSLPLWLIHS